MTGRLYASTPSGERVCLARVLANSVQVDDTRWRHWIRMEFASAFSADYTYSTFPDFAAARAWLEMLCRNYASQLGLIGAEVDWESQQELTDAERTRVTRAVRNGSYVRALEEVLR